MGKWYGVITETRCWLDGPCLLSIRVSQDHSQIQIILLELECDTVKIVDHIGRNVFAVSNKVKIARYQGLRHFVTYRDLRWLIKRIGGVVSSSTTTAVALGHVMDALKKNCYGEAEEDGQVYRLRQLYPSFLRICSTCDFHELTRCVIFLSLLHWTVWLICRKSVDIKLRLC